MFWWYRERSRSRAINALDKCLTPLWRIVNAKIDRIEDAMAKGEYSHPISAITPLDCGAANVKFIGRRNYKWLNEKLNEFNDFATNIIELTKQFKKAIIVLLKEKYPDVIKSERDMRYLVFCIADNYQKEAKTHEGIREFGNVHRKELLGLRCEEEVLREYITLIEKLLLHSKSVAEEIKTKLEKIDDGYSWKYAISPLT